MPTKGHEGHDPGRPDGTSPHPPAQRDSEHPGYEVQDVNVGGIVTFLAGLTGFVLVFFFLCYGMGKLINTTLVNQDGAANKWRADLSQPGMTPRGTKRDDLASNADIEQRQLKAVADNFPTPTLETDDGNQDIADLHSREDLLLNYTSTTADGTMRIPIDQAMKLVVQRGLPKASAAAAPKTLMAGETEFAVQAPLTSGFARTGYELQTMEARKQKNEYEAATGKKE